MKTTMGISSLRLASLAVAGGFMLLFTGCQQEDVPVADSQNLIITNDQTRAAKPSANGQGGLILNEELQNFAFHAKEKNRSVSGSFTSNSPGQDFFIHGDIYCLTVMPNGQDAIMSGIVTDVNLGPEPFFTPEVGDYIWFKVRDNGEGNNAPTDQFSDWWLFGSDPNCGNFGFSLQDIENGNIQVKP
jgi:hypothetical protein